MSKDAGSVASSDYSWMKLYAAVAALPLALAACGGGGGGGGTATPPQSPPPSPSPAPTPSSPTLVVTPSSTVTTQGGATITLTATVTNSSDTPTWTLTGPGSLSASSGAAVVYTPPAAGSLTANTTVSIAAALTGATTQTVKLAVDVTMPAGLSWTNVTAPAAGNLVAVDFADGRYVAVSDQGSALASGDAATWTPVTLFTSNLATDHFKAYSVAHLGNTYAAGGAISPSPYGSATGAAAYSSDGVTWTMAALPAGATPLHGLIAGSRLVGLGEGGHLYFSTDGRSWSALTTLTGPGTLNAGVFGGGKYIAVGNGGYIAASSDSVAWLAGMVVTNSGGAGIDLHGVAWTGSQYVAVGDNGAITTSPNGSAWSALKTSAITGALRSVAVSSSGEIVVVGDNGIETSEDGNTWTARDPAGAAALYGVTYANGRFVAVGANSAIKSSTGS